MTIAHSEAATRGAPCAEEHGIHLPLAALVPYDPHNGDRQFWVDKTSPACDGGVLLPNFNDDFVGTAPDIGAFERGAPACRYGTEAYLEMPTSIREEDGLGNLVPGAQHPPGLAPNYPNPFNSSTTLAFTCAPGAHVYLGAYDLLGQELVTLVNGYEGFPGPTHTVHWDGRDRAGHSLGSGLYLGVLRTQDEILVRKLALIR